ncbi:Glucan endo-1 [Escovopsis weberi]|uniref:Glucan endo-1 n=1 Tax=Escovopsis weberi TaxID=150374 RepID=A0A0M9VT52_ESCWE|nr:Glucan endo-1 [Escovopsis weberi]
MINFLGAAALLLGVVAPASARSLRSREINSDQASTYWYAKMDHVGAARGIAPEMGSTYQVFRSVSPGDGAGIQAAINDDNGAKRHGQWLSSQPRAVYIPPGEYVIEQTIFMNTDTILYGDPTNPPIIKAAANFTGNLVLVQGQDPATGISGELSFAVGLKNLILDSTAINATAAFTCLGWGVAQATQIQNVKIVMPESANGKGHTGIKMTRGSSIAVADVRVENGQNGIWFSGHQQASFHDVYFFQNTIGFLMSGGDTVTIFNPTFDTCGHGVSNTGGNPWIALIDATSINSGVTFQTNQFASFMIENLSKDTIDSPVAIFRGETVIGPVTHVSTFTYGNTVGGSPIYGPVTTNNTRPKALAPGGRYPSVPVPTFANSTVSDFINIKDPKQNGGRQVLGDNTVDESGVLNEIFQDAAAQGKKIYMPYGLYRVDSTVFLPPGSILVGEMWATITASGSFFNDSSNPQPVVSVGRPGDVGVGQIQDIRVTVSQPLKGAILVQFNMAGNKPGDVGLFNSLVTIGGTRGATELTETCTDASNECQAAFLGVHLAKTSSAVLKNNWIWVADHITEDFSGGSSIAGKGGVLVESTVATWIYGLGSEHWWIYQFNLHNAVNVVVSMLQSETNYEQGTNAKQIVPAPWTVDATNWGDPTFSWCGKDDKFCRMGPSNYINGGANIYTYASASWAFFSGPGFQGCATFKCQQTMHWIAKTPSNLQAFGICSKDAQNILRLANNATIPTSPDFTGSWPGGGGDIGRYTP